MYVLSYFTISVQNDAEECNKVVTDEIIKKEK